MFGNGHLRAVLLLTCTELVGPESAQAQTATVRIEAPSEIVLGDPTGIVLRGLRPGSIVRMHALRRTVASSFRNGESVQTPVVVHAYADFVADANGTVSVDRKEPRGGTYAEADINGLLWSGWPVGDPRLVSSARSDLGAETLSDNRTLLVVPEVGGRLLEARRITLRSFAEDVVFRELNVAMDGVSGVFAVPAGGGRLPAVIELHGSEGGSMAQARQRAGILAQRGFAALSLNYVAYSWTGGIAGVEPTLANVPIETLDRARRWLERQERVMPGGVSLYGGSKGAEFALVAATRFDWVRSVVACVPSDVVWAGYGREPKPGEKLSSWSWRGQPLPFIPYDRYEDVFSGKATAAAVHVRSRARASKAEITAARIPVERIRAPVLLLGAGKDQVWPSGEMAEAVGKRMKNRRAEVAIFADASHNICGTGSSTQREDGQDAAADAAASGVAFRKTVEFLGRSRR